MPTKKSKIKLTVKPADAKNNPNALEVPQEPEETKADAKAQYVIAPNVIGTIWSRVMKVAHPPNRLFEVNPTFIGKRA